MKGNKSMKFSEKLRYLRIENGFSQEELAEKFGISRQTVSKWESGISLPEVDKLIALSDYFEVTIDYLLRDKQINLTSSESLDRMIVQFLSSSYDMTDISQQLVEIMEDGIIDSSERLQLEQIICTMDKIAKNLEKIRNMLRQDIRAECNDKNKKS